MKNLKISSTCICALAAFFVVGCQSLPLSTGTCQPSQFYASYHIGEDQLRVTLVNVGRDDLLVEIPAMGLEYSVTYEIPDGTIDEFTNGRSPHLVESAIRVLKRCEDKRYVSPYSSLFFEIPWQDSTRTVKRLELLVRYADISALNSVRTSEDLERLFFKNEKSCLAQLVGEHRGQP